MWDLNELEELKKNELEELKKNELEELKKNELEELKHMGKRRDRTLWKHVAKRNYHAQVEMLRGRPLVCWE